MSLVTTKKTVQVADSDIENMSPSASNGTKEDTDNKQAHVLETRMMAHPTNSFINCPADLPNFPIAFPQLKLAQQQDESIQNAAHHSDEAFHNCDLKVHQKNDGTSKIVPPESSVDATIKWHHHTLGHADSDRPP